MVHLVGKVGDRPAVEELILVPHVQIDILRKRPVDPDKGPVLVEAGLGSARTDCVQVNEDFV